MILWQINNPLETFSTSSEVPQNHNDLIGGGGGVYSYIHVMPDGFLLKSVVLKLISKEISRAEHEYIGGIKKTATLNILRYSYCSKHKIF